MIQDCRLPPLYRFVPLDPGVDVAEEACRQAAAGADPATLFCCAGEDRLEFAVVLHPETPLAEARLVLYIATLGLGDALGVVVPAGLDVTYTWPNLIAANMGSVARITVTPPVDAEPGSVPAWLVLHLTVVFGPLPGEGLHEGFPGTSLRDEGCAEVTMVELLESFARHFLTWLNRWQDDGLDPVRAMWLRHSPDHGSTIEIEVEGKQVTGIFQGIDDDGALLLGQGESTLRVALDAALGERTG